MEKSEMNQTERNILKCANEKLKDQPIQGYKVVIWRLFLASKSLPEIQLHFAGDTTEKMNAYMPEAQETAKIAVTECEEELRKREELAKLKTAPEEVKAKYVASEVTQIIKALSTINANESASEKDELYAIIEKDVVKYLDKNLKSVNDFLNKQDFRYDQNYDRSSLHNWIKYDPHSNHLDEIMNYVEIAIINRLRIPPREAFAGVESLRDKIIDALKHHVEFKNLCDQIFKKLETKILHQLIQD